MNTYLGPLVKYKRQGKGIRYFKETKVFVEGQYVNDYITGTAEFLKIRQNGQENIKIIGNWEKDLLKGEVKLF